MKEEEKRDQFSNYNHFDCQTRLKWFLILKYVYEYMNYCYILMTKKCRFHY